MTRLSPIHPGDILKEEFMVPLGLSSNALALAIGVPGNRISEIVAGRRAITADTALRLSRYFGLSPEYWIDLQGHYDLRAAQIEAERRGSDLAKALRVIQPLAPGPHAQTTS